MDLVPNSGWMRVLRVLTVAALSCAAPPQGLCPNGDFENGAAGWQSVRFDDPAGSIGVGVADVGGSGSSQALYADFVSPSLDAHADWLSDPLLFPDGRWPVRFAVMWQKTTPVQIPDPSGNWAELRLLDPGGRTVFTGHVPVPQQTNLLERRSYTGEVVVPVAGRYRAMISMRHSAASGMGFRAWIDDVVVGVPGWTLLGDGCAGSGGSVAMISAPTAPTIGMRSWSVLLSGANAPSTAWLVLGVSTTSWYGVPLPFDAGGGCLLRVGILTGFGTPVNGATPGTGQYPIPLPYAPALRGAVLHVQWLVLDPGSGSPFGLTVSPGMTATIQ